MNIITVARFHEHCYGDRVRESKKKKKKKKVGVEGKKEKG